MTEMDMERFGRIDSLGSLTNFLENVGQHFDLPMFYLQNMPLDRKRTFERDHVTDNWMTSDIARFYTGNDIINESRMAAFVGRTMTPRVLHPAGGSKANNGFRFKFPPEYFKSSGIDLVAKIPVFSYSGRFGLLSFSGSRKGISSQELMRLTMVGRYAFDQACRMHVEYGPVLKLSEKERGCLFWAARGKTTYEISRILSIPEATVNYYFGRAGKKLDAANRSQAVAKYVMNSC